MDDERLRREKWIRFKHLLKEPWPKMADGFPLIITDQPFNLEDYQSESMGYLPDAFLGLVKALPEGTFLDLGCGFRGDVLFPNLLNLEVYPSRSADVVVDSSCRYPFVDEAFDGIGCFAVLEHTRQPWVVVEEITRMLKPGGKVFIDWPFLQPVHGYPSHFFNATREGLKTIFEDRGFQVEHAITEPHQSVAYTVSWVLGSFNHNLPAEMRPELLDMTVGDLMSLDRHGEVWNRWVKALPPAAQEELACGNTLIAEKNAQGFV